MKTFIRLRDLILRPAVLLLILGISYSCEKQQFEEDNLSDMQRKAPRGEALATKVTYFSETFTITSKDALVAERQLASPDFSNYEDFTITVKNGKSGKTKVTRMEIRVDGRTIITYKDFKRNASEVTKSLPDLTGSSLLQVKLEGSKNRFITVTINAYSRTSSITDVEGNAYKTVKIGDQWWMAENLKTTKFNDGTVIPVITGASEWLSTAAGYLPEMCWYGNNLENKSSYGALYNWQAAGNDKLCPAGWHVPTSQDYYELCLFIDPEAAIGYYSAVAGGVLKETGTAHWFDPNEGATDKYGFMALPGGVRNVEGEFANLGTGGSWWSDNGLSSINMSYDNSYASFSEGGNEYGRSVRCVKD